MLERRRRTEARTLPGGARHRPHETGWRMAVDQRAPRHHVVDEAITVDVLDDGTRRTPDEERRSADRLERPDRTVDPAREHVARAGEELLAADRLSHERRSRAASRA